MATRRRWDWTTKARLVSASFAAGSSVAAVARSQGLSVDLIYAWRRALCERRRDRGAGGAFVPVVVAEARKPAPIASALSLPDAGRPEDAIEIALVGGRVVIRGRVDAQAVGAVLAALK